MRVRRVPIHRRRADIILHLFLNTPPAMEKIMKTYKVIEGVSFSENTPDAVIRVLLNARSNRRRIRIWYGDQTTGKSWEDENDMTGTVSTSTGTTKIPLLVARQSSFGGLGMLDDCIIKIAYTDTRLTAYIHPLFNQDRYIAYGGNTLSMKNKGYTARVMTDGKLYANCKTLTSARRLANYMNGVRMGK